MPRTTSKRPMTQAEYLAKNKSLLASGDTRSPLARAVNWTPNETELVRGLLSGTNDVIGRGAVAGLLGTPGDIAGLVENTYRGAVGLPQVIPYGGSEHIGQKLEDAGLVSAERRPKTELAASLLSPSAVAKTVINTPKTAMNMFRMADNLDAPSLGIRNAQGMYIPRGQMGAIDTGLLSKTEIEPKLTRAEIIQKARALGMPTYEKNAEMLEKIRILESNPATWSVDDFNKIVNHLDIHQDFQGGGLDPKGLESILSEGLRSGMSDNLGAMYSKNYYTYGKNLQGGRSFIFPSAAINYKSKTNPAFAPGNKPLFYMDATKNQDIFEAFKNAKRNPYFGK